MGREGDIQIRCAVFQRQLERKRRPRNALRRRRMADGAFTRSSGVENIHVRGSNDLHVVLPFETDRVQVQLLQVSQQLLQARENARHCACSVKGSSVRTSF